MEDVARLQLLVPALAFALAFVFGAVAQRVNFCTMGAVTDIANFGDWRRMRMWLLAIATAIAGTAVLTSTGLIDVRKSFYTAAQVPWLSNIVGGFLFGFGMTLSSGCGSKTLLRVGAGNMKSLIVLIFLGLSAYMTLRGVLAPPRVNGLDRVRMDLAPLGAASSDLGTVSGALGLGAIALWIPFIVAIAIGAFVLASREFRAAREMLVGGLVIGLVVVGGWYISGHLGFVAEDPATLEEKFVATNSGRMESFSFTAPVAYLIEWLMLWTDASRIITFGIAGVLGMILGSGAMALATRSFRWEGFTNREDLANHIVGGVMMGFGGVTALGCTIGQGLTGLSTLALGSILTFGGIIGGCLAAVRYQIWRIEATA
ncbi:MAG TPA: YeeE/YedE family protein [Casimicrobiaceae bacterium]|nr:YeeE/YedE family protein [Casimicrobiaceae bacterium]